MNLGHDIVDISRDIRKPIVAILAVAGDLPESGHSIEHPPLVIIVVLFLDICDEGAAKVPGANAAVCKPCAHMGILSDHAAVSGRHCPQGGLSGRVAGLEYGL